MEPATGEHRPLGQGRREQEFVETVFTATKRVSVDTGRAVPSSQRRRAPGPSPRLAAPVNGCRPPLPEASPVL